jgi:Zinc finger C-x8-C-x5-C-x3-H type (and similar)
MLLAVQHPHRFAIANSFVYFIAGKTLDAEGNLSPADGTASPQTAAEVDGGGVFAIDFAQAQQEAEHLRPRLPRPPAGRHSVQAVTRSRCPSHATDVRVCRFHRRGRCRFGNACSFQHIRERCRGGLECHQSRDVIHQSHSARGQPRTGCESQQTDAAPAEVLEEALRRPDPRQMPAELYMKAEERALEAFQAGPPPPQVALADVHTDAGGMLPVAYPRGSVWDCIERYFGSVEAVLHTAGVEWATAWGIEQAKQSVEYAELLRQFGTG